MIHDKTITHDLEKVVNVIENNEVVAFPTGTVYGLAVNALSSLALNNLRIVKNRPKEKTFTVFLSESLIDTFFSVSDKEKIFLQRAQNLPLTVLLTPQKALSHLSQDGFVGLRLIDHPLMKSLASAFPYPLTATSANMSGEEACLSPVCIGQKLPQVSCIWGGKELKASPPSTIVLLKNEEIIEIREGGVPTEELRKFI